MELVATSCIALLPLVVLRILLARSMSSFGIARPHHLNLNIVKLVPFGIAGIHLDFKILLILLLELLVKCRQSLRVIFIHHCLFNVIQFSSLVVHFGTLFLPELAAPFA